jgi:hypothetical protein
VMLTAERKKESEMKRVWRWWWWWCRAGPASAAAHEGVGEKENWITRTGTGAYPLYVIFNMIGREPTISQISPSQIVWPELDLLRHIKKKFAHMYICTCTSLSCTVSAAAAAVQQARDESIMVSSWPHLGCLQYSRGSNSPSRGRGGNLGGCLCPSRHIRRSST